MGQKHKPSDHSAQRTRAPTSEDRMDANGKDVNQKEPDQHQLGHRQSGESTGKHARSKPAPRKQHC